MHSTTDWPSLSRALRIAVLRMASHTAHVAVSLSCVDLIAVVHEVLFARTGQRPPEDPADGDTFILSKGHGCMALYAVLDHYDWLGLPLGSYAADGSRLAEHPLAGEVPGIPFATGSLGHGLGFALGLAHAHTLARRPHRVTVLLGDGECNEGSVWESAALASALGVDRLTALVDHNDMQACGRWSDLSRGSDLAAQWRAVGWQVVEVDGHHHEAVAAALEEAPEPGRPRVLLCHTVKGKGISFMENDLEWHYRPVSDADFERAVKELDHA